MRKLKVLITILTLLLFVGITHVMQSMEVEEEENEISEEKNEIWIKAGGKVKSICKKKAMRLGYIEGQLSFREKQNWPVTNTNPINLDVITRDPFATKYVVEYLLMHNRKRETFLRDLNQKNLKAFFSHLDALSANTKLILLPKVLKYFGNWHVSKTVLDGHKNCVPCLSFNSNGNRLASASFGKKNNFILWNGRTGEKIKVLCGHGESKNRIYSLVFSPDSKRLLSGLSGKKNNLILRDGRTGEKIKVLHGNENDVNVLVFSPDSKRLLSGLSGKKNNLILRDGRTGEIIKMLNGHDNDVNISVFSPDSNRLVSGSKGKENNLILWDGRTGKKIKVLHGHDNDVNVSVFSPDSNRLVSGSKGKENNLILWDGRTGKKIKVLHGHDNDVNVSVFSSSSRYLMEGKRNNHFLWDCKTGKKIKMPYVDKACWFKVITRSPDGNLFVSISKKNNKPILWDKRISKETKILDVDKDLVKIVKFSPDSRSLVFGLSGTQNNLILCKIYYLNPELLTPQETGFLYRAYWAAQDGEIMDASVEDYEIFAELDQAIQELIENSGVLHAGVFHID